jgi:DNA-directed RNA polymerase
MTIPGATANGGEPLLTQEQVELRMYHGGINRAEAMMDKAEQAGRAHQNPYAKEVFREYVLPLAEAIKADTSQNRAGRRQAHAKLLDGLDPQAVAFLAVRGVLNACMGAATNNIHRVIAYRIGSSVHSELVLAQIEQHNPELYHSLARDMQRRLSKDERHRMTVFKMQAKKADIEIIEWPIGARDQVGMYLLGLLEQSGLVFLNAELPSARNKTGYKSVHLSLEVMQRIDQIKGFVAVTMPVYGPCVEMPRDWLTPTDGGFHTNVLRRTNPLLVHCSASSRHLYRTAPMPIVLNAVNALQRTAWQVNTELLDTILAVSKSGQQTEEIVSLQGSPSPAAPSWLTKDLTKEQIEAQPESRKDEFKRWKRQMAEWHTQRKLMGVRYGRFYSATRSAEMFRAYPKIHFVYFADSRGRLYPMTYGLNPQGSDLQKALLRFAEGKPLDTPEAVRWFHVQGANKFGYDKATLAERQQWVVDRQDLILSFAADPVNNAGWMKAGDPMQFLAWCFEYSRWVKDATGSFQSHLPISMDGSCNGLQNLSALLRDSVGGKATNLTANTVMEDIYRRVADAALLRMQAASFTDDPEKEQLRRKWVEHGISRSVVKRSVMTTPYGVTQRTATDYVVSDYLAAGEAKGVFERPEYFKAASLLMSFVWPAIGDVVVKGREAMDWLKRSARAIIKKLPADQEPVIWWETPSGFPASQAYFEAEVHRIATRLHGVEKIRVLSETDDPDGGKHASGLAPNFVHSMDAAHLHRTTAAANLRRIDALAMIHDDYGTHAANAQALYEIIREEFVSMYREHDPIMDFAERYPMAPPPPEKGTLDIREVLDSPYFFS